MNMKIIEMTSSWGSLSMPTLHQPLIDIITSDAMECYKDSVSIRDQIFINFRCCYLNVQYEEETDGIVTSMDTTREQGPDLTAILNSMGLGLGWLCCSCA